MIYNLRERTAPIDTPVLEKKTVAKVQKKKTTVKSKGQAKKTVKNTARNVQGKKTTKNPARIIDESRKNVPDNYQLILTSSPIC